MDEYVLNKIIEFKIKNDINTEVFMHEYYENTYKNVTYYRYRDRTYKNNNNTYKWSSCNDSSLTSQGFVATGKTK